jgi:hypothetical protein
MRRNDRTYANPGMNFRARIISVLIPAIIVAGCTTLTSTRVDSRNFAVDTYQPGPQQAAVADRRAKQFWAKNSGRYGAEPRLLAVVCGLVNASDLGVPFSAKVDHSETTATYFNHGIYSDSQIVTGVMIFDTKTNQLIARQGYIFVDTPSMGTMIHVQDLTVRYIGRG